MSSFSVSGCEPQGRALSPRQALRWRLLAERESFASGTTLAAAQQALGRHLAALLVRLEPSCLGLYCPVRSEFNAIDALTADSAFAALPLALPAAGTSLSYSVLCGNEFCGLGLYLQVLELDPGASQGVSFTTGLELIHGR